MTRKHLLWISVGLVGIGPASAWGYATGIQLISEQHHVWGYAGSDTQYGPGGTEVRYDQTSSDPLHVSVTGTYWDDRLGGAVGLTSWSRAGDFSAEAFSTYWFSQAHAESTYVFLPQADVRALTFQLTSSGDGVVLPESHIAFSLIDLTTGTLLSSLAAPSDPDWHNGSTWSCDWPRTCPTDPTHTYAMTLFASADGGDNTRHALLDMDVLTAVPAPGALLLALLGAVLASRLRRSPIR